MGREWMMEDGGVRGDKGDVTFFSEESNKEPVCDVKVKLIKLKGDTAALCPVAGKNLNRSVRSKLQPGDSSFFPLGLVSPARADCIGVPRGRGWMRKTDVVE